MSSKYADFVVDARTGRVLHATNADAPRHPASLTKMMTLYILFEEMERGRFNMDSELRVSQHASAQSPTKLWLRPGDTIAVSDAIRGIVTQSANDVAVTIAENIAGSEGEFARRMTQTARRLGMKNTYFYNASGLPNAGQITTARDIVTLGRALQERFPQNYRVFSTRSFAYHGRVYGNHNHLLGSVDGIDGIKTGYTDASGFNIVTSVKRDGHFVVGAVFGGPSARARDAQMVRLLDTSIAEASTGTRVASVFTDAKMAARDDDEKPTAPIPVPALHDREPTATLVAATARPRAAQSEIATEGNATKALSMPKPHLAPQQAKPDDRIASIIMAKAIQRDQKQRRQTVASLDDFIPAAPTRPIARTEALARETERATTAETDHNERLMTASLEPVHGPASGEQSQKSEPKARSASRDGWLVQIAAVDNASAAKQILAKAQSAVGSRLRDGTPVAEPVVKGSSTLYRARFAGFSDQKSADNACKALKRKDFDCLVIRQ